MVRPFLNGFAKVLDLELLKVLNENELNMMMSGGRQGIDTKDLENCCEYRAGYKKTDKYIKEFWKIVHSMTESQKRNLLLFVTCCEKAPLFGFKNMNPAFTLQKPDTSNDSSLPVAHTCFNMLRLPQYSSTKLLKEKLLFAISYNTGFGVV